MICSTLMEYHPPPPYSAMFTMIVLLRFVRLKNWTSQAKIGDSFHTPLSLSLSLIRYPQSECLFTDKCD